MPVFLGKHNVPAGTTEEAVKENWEKYKTKALAKGLRPLHATMSIEEGFAYCETDAPNAQAVTDAHTDAGLTVDEVVEVINFE